MNRAYLDYNATAKLRPEAAEAMIAALERTGNPSSVHGEGRAARKLVEDARSNVAALAGVRPAQVIFNAGATEGNNTILSGYAPDRIAMLATEHPSVIEAAPSAHKIPVDKNGVIDLAALQQILAAQKIDLVCVQLVNSETGVIQPVADAASLAHSHGAKLHCDAVQAAGRIPLDFAALGCDTLTLSAHKFGGPMGIGALIFANGLQLPKLLRGGGQERRQRAGTENVPGVAGFGAAARLAAEQLQLYRARTAAFQERLERQLKEIAPDAVIAGMGASRVTNTTAIILPGAAAETQLMALDLAGIAVSSGSACSSGSFKPSHVLTAMDFSEAEARSSLRFSTGWATTDADIDAALTAYATMAARVRK